MTPEDIAALAGCVEGGGVAVFPADTVYGLACDPGSAAAVDRLYELKGRPADKPAAVMFLGLGAALAALPELGPRTRAALERLLPGAVTVLLPNPLARYPLACGPDPWTLGLRVPAIEGALPRPLLQSSANLTAGADARTLAEVPDGIRSGADLVLDGGELPGTPSSVVDMRRFEQAGEWQIVRAGAVDEAGLVATLGP